MAENRKKPECPDHSRGSEGHDEQPVEQFLLFSAGHLAAVPVGHDHIATLSAQVFHDMAEVYQAGIVDPEEIKGSQDPFVLFQVTGYHEPGPAEQEDLGVAFVGDAFHNVIHTDHLKAFEGGDGDLGLTALDREKRGLSYAGPAHVRKNRPVAFFYLSGCHNLILHNSNF
jgi:hypothetical protein